MNLDSFIPNSIKHYAIEYFRTGSRIICNPPPLDTDDDYLVLLNPGDIDDVEGLLRNRGYVRGGSENSSSDKKLLVDITEEDTEGDRSSVFHSWKKTGGFNKITPDGLVAVDDTLNIILTCNREYFENFRLATGMAQALNLTNKFDRVMLFEAVCFNLWPVIKEV